MMVRNNVSISSVPKDQVIIENFSHRNKIDLFPGNSSLLWKNDNYLSKITMFPWLILKNLTFWIKFNLLCDFVNMLTFAWSKIKKNRLELGQDSFEKIFL